MKVQTTLQSPKCAESFDVLKNLVTATGPFIPAFTPSWSLLFLAAGRMHHHLQHSPNRACDEGSNGFFKGPLRGVRGQWSLILIRKKRYLVAFALVSPTRNRGSRAQTPIFSRRKSTFFGPDGSSPAWPGPSPVRGQILEIWEPGNPEMWNSKKSTK